jgi:nitrite reductase/ring-hydroxylating ferredoxin subunit
MSGSDRFDEAVDKIVADQSPRAQLAGLSAEEQRMVRMAQLLHGTQTHTVDPAFSERLHDRLFGGGRKYSRRTAFLSGLGAMAAGLLAGLGLDRSLNGSSNNREQASTLVGKNGRWVPVAQVVELPHGAVRSFSAGALQGYLINHHGQLRAVSRICTHMGCSVNFNNSEQHFVCPCHGAEFDVNGRFLYGPGGRPYSPALSPLPAIGVRVKGTAVEVWTV